MGIKIKSKTNSNPLYTDGDFRDRLVTLRNDGKNWDDVSRILKKEYDCTISSQLSSDLYSRITATTITLERKAGADYSRFRDELKRMYGDSLDKLKILMKALDIILNKFTNSNDEEELNMAYKLMKMMPSIKGLISEIREFNKFQKEQEDTIKAQQEKLYYTPQAINKQLELVLKTLAKEGKIKIIKDLNFQ